MLKLYKRPENYSSNMAQMLRYANNIVIRADNEDYLLGVKCIRANHYLIETVIWTFSLSRVVVMIIIGEGTSAITLSLGSGHP